MSEIPKYFVYMKIRWQDSQGEWHIKFMESLAFFDKNKAQEHFRNLPKYNTDRHIVEPLCIRISKDSKDWTDRTEIDGYSYLDII